MFICFDYKKVLTVCNSEDVSTSSFIASDNKAAWERVAQKVQQRRTEVGISSQRELARRAGVGETFVALLETASQHRIRKSNGWKIEAALGWEDGAIERLLFFNEEPLVNDEIFERHIDSVSREDFDELKETVERLEQTVNDFVVALRSSLPKPRRR